MSVTETAPPTFLRPDGKEKVTGSGRYTADLNLTGQLHAKFRYADHTHARIVSIDASKARALPGVLAVLTHEDVPDALRRPRPGPRLFAREGVRFEGDIVAAVAALTPEIAAAAAAAVEVEYEPLPAVSDIEAALADDALLIHPDWESYEADEALGERQRPRLFHDREGRRRRRHGRGRRRRQGPLRHRRFAGCADRAARAPGPMGGRPRHRLEPRRRSPTPLGPASLTSFRSRSRTCASSSRSSAAGSARSAISTTKGTSRRSPAPRGGPSSSCSRARRSSSRPTTVAKGW